MTDNKRFYHVLHVFLFFQDFFYISKHLKNTFMDCFSHLWFSAWMTLGCIDSRILVCPVTLKMHDLKMTDKENMGLENARVENDGQ